MKNVNRRSLSAAAVLAIAGLAACGGGEPASDAGSATPASSTSNSSASTGPTGRIRGVVKLAGELPAGQTRQVTENQSVCGDEVPTTRLSLGDGGGVRNAFVYLDGIKGTGHPQTQATLELAQEDCSYAPRALVMPMGASLEIVNDDPILHNVHARAATADGMRTVFNIAQPVRGQRTKLDAPFTSTGVVTLSCEAGHPWMAAYMLVADHPYVAVSGANGEFVIDNVPAGTYPLRMWHEGIQLTRVVEHMQLYEYEAPYEATSEVVVPPNGEAVVEFALALR